MTRTQRFALILALMVVSFAAGALTVSQSHATPERRSPYAPLSQLARVLVLMENQYVDPVERRRILDGAIKGMVAELDPHSAYMTPEEFARFNEDTEGSFGGVGVEVDFKADRIVVIAPIPGSPAARAGIRSGDVIVAVDDKPLRSMPMDKIVLLMRGPAKTKVRVSIKRKGADKLLHFDLVREHIRVRSVESKRLLSEVGYLRLKQFQHGTHLELLEEIGKLRKSSKAKLAGVILDMRSNPGGLIDEAEAVANEFLSSGVIYSTRHRGKVLDEVRAHLGGALTSLPLVVMVNAFSASSAELVAGALQDNKRATTVGGQTFGKGSVQTIFQLRGAAGLRLTTMRYYTPSGHAIQAAGIVPEVLIRFEEDEKFGGPLLRESNLHGHLPAEQRRKNNAHAAIHVAKKRPVYKPIEKLPIDPAKGDDFALGIAHGLVLKKAATKKD